MKRPAFMFYPADWRKDPELRVCSIATRGLWIDMMALMHEGEPYGHLVVNGRAVSDAELARLVGEPVRAVVKLLAELEAHNVFSRTASGVVYSRRMVADEHIREVRAAAGKLGGNPNLLHKHGDKRQDNGKVKQTGKQKVTPSVAVAVSDSPSEQQDQKPVADATVPKAKRPPPPWMGRMAAAWTLGELPGGSATALAPVVAAVGGEEAARRLTEYCEATDPRFASVRDFVAKHATFAGDSVVVDPRTGTLTAAGMRALGIAR